MEVLSFAAGPPHPMLWICSSILVPPAKYDVSIASVSLTNTESSTGPFTGSGVINWFPVAPNRLVQSYGGVVAALCTMLPSSSNMPVLWTACAAPMNISPATTKTLTVAIRRTRRSRAWRKLRSALIYLLPPFDHGQERAPGPAIPLQKELKKQADANEPGDGLVGAVLTPRPVQGA